MSGHALRERLRLLDELRQIVTAMRNLAYVELQRLGRMRPSQLEAAGLITQALADLGACAEPVASATICLVIGAERGFCGGFNESLLAELPTLRERWPQAHWLLAGERLRQAAAGQLPEAQPLPGASTAEEATRVVERWLEQLRPFCPGPVHLPELWVLHHAEEGVALQTLLPLPALPPAGRGPAPGRQLSADTLLHGLRQEYLRIGLLGALQQSLEQENRWRLAQMQRAEDHLDTTSERLNRLYFRQRQSDITNELEILMASL